MKFEQLSTLASTAGFTFPENQITNDLKVIAEQSQEIAKLKLLLSESRGDASVARATAAAVISSNGNLTDAESLALLACDNCDDISTVDDGEDEEKLSSTLMAVCSEIEQKEAMAAQVNKERLCMGKLRSHFEGAVKKLQQEVETLNTEKSFLMNKLESVNSSSIRKGPKMPRLGNNDSDNDVDQRRTRKRIVELEKRIILLNKKVAEHSKSLRLRELAEKKCVQLSEEIAEAKKQHAALQQRLKEETKKRKQEKNEARKQAVRMLRDSKKLKNELSRIKDTAAKQAAVLRRKMAEAMSKQKMAAEQQRKRQNAASMLSNAFNSKVIDISPLRYRN